MGCEHDKPAVHVGWLTADVAEPTTFTATTPTEGSTFQLSGVIVPCVEHGQAAVDVRALGWATLTEGMIVPVWSDVRPSIDGIYQVVSAGEATDAAWPAMASRGDIDSGQQVPQERSVSVGLRRLTQETAKVTTSLFGNSYAVSSPVQFSSTYWPRAGVAGAPEGALPSGFTLDAYSDNPLEGRLTRVAFPRLTSLSLTTYARARQFLAGSPRVEVFAAGVWWPMHGQPPAGYPVRLRNGKAGIELPFAARPAVGNSPATPMTEHRLLQFDQSTGELKASPALTISQFLTGMANPSTLTVIHADSETLRVTWMADRDAPFAGGIQTTVTRWEAELRRGEDGFSFWASLRGTMSIAATHNSDVNDGNGHIIGVRAVNSTGITLVGQREVSLGTSVGAGTAQVNDMGQRFRVEVDGASYRTRNYTRQRVVVGPAS